MSSQLKLKLKFRNLRRFYSVWRNVPLGPPDPVLGAN